MFPVSKEIVVRLIMGEDIIITLTKITSIIISSHLVSAVFITREVRTHHRGNIADDHKDLLSQNFRPSINKIHLKSDDRQLTEESHKFNIQEEILTAEV